MAARVPHALSKFSSRSPQCARSESLALDCTFLLYFSVCDSCKVRASLGKSMPATPETEYPIKCAKCGEKAGWPLLVRTAPKDKLLVSIGCYCCDHQWIEIRDCLPVFARREKVSQFD